MAKKTARAQPAPKPQKRRQRAEPPEPLDLELEISSIGHEDPDVRRARQLAIVAAANARIAADPRAFDAALAALKAKSKSKRTRDAGTDDTEQSASEIISTSTDRAANVERWAELLTMFRRSRAHDLRLAKHRDEHQALGSDPTHLVPLIVLGARHAGAAGVRGSVLPVPSRDVEAARASGRLRDSHYNDHRVLEPVTWRWMRAIQEYINSEADLEAAAEAYARGQGERWFASDKTRVASAVRKLRSLYQRAVPAPRSALLGKRRG
ncbi:MAG: hypothetical protein M3619_20420 [Myxococcota bacterium]|nr:hypothetical protein [Myxococcota bacterium]